MTIKTTPALLDRLDKALGKQGLNLKRTQLLEVAAAAFGHRNSNAMTAAARAGDFALAPVQPSARIQLANGETLIVLLDPAANASYAIDESFLEQVVNEERGEEAGITPYGHLVDLNPALDWNGEIICQGRAPDDVELVDIHIGIISHKHGSSSYAAFSEQDLYLQMKEYVLENWYEIEQWSDEQPDDMSPEDAVDAYFDLCNEHSVEESLDLSSETARLPMRLPSPAPAAELITLAEHLEVGLGADIWYRAHDLRSNDPGDPDREKKNQIEIAQQAMTKAAALLRAIAAGGRTLAKAETVAGPEARPENSRFMANAADWADTLTAEEQALAGVGRTLNRDCRYPVKLGTLARDNDALFVVPIVEFHFEEDDFDGAVSALARAERYINQLDPLLDRLDAEAELMENTAEGVHTLNVFIPMAAAKGSTTAEDWFAGLSYLLLTREEKEAGKQVICEFTSQMDVRKYIISVDPLGDTTWDGTFDALRWGKDAAAEMLRLDPDEFARSPMAPDWVQNWGGPFVVDPIGLEELFGL